MASKEKSENSLSLSARIEGLLFVAPAGVAPSHLASALGVSVREVEAGLTELDEHYQSRALRLQNYRGRYQITSAPEIAALIEKFLELESSFRMTRAALETLSIVAYQQPVTKPHIDSIRGVNSDSVMRNLLSKGLVMEAGRDEGPGRPIFYITSAEFLQHFGLNKLEDLPSLELDPEPAEEGNKSEEQAPLLETEDGQEPPKSDGDAEAQNGRVNPSSPDTDSEPTNLETPDAPTAPEENPN